MESSGNIGSGGQGVGGSSGGGVSVDSGSGGTRSIPAPRWLGKRVGRFKLLALLGQGAMGRVFRAEDTLMGRHVALKLLPKTYKKSGVSVGPEMLINEARAAAAIEHPNAVQIYEVNQAGDVCYVAMELLEGGSLRDLVRAAGPLDLTRACLLCAEAAEALAAAHAAGVVHRDVKPANLMLSRQGRCKVVDFGLARLDGPGDWGSAAESVGTPQFIAPEILNGTPASAQSDIYSLGGTLWYLLTGNAPYQGKDAQELLRMHRDSPVPDLRAVRPEAPLGLADALRTALAKRPAERFATMEQLARVLRVHAIPIAASAESLGMASPPMAMATPAVQRPARPATPLHASVPKREEHEPEPGAETVFKPMTAPHPGIGWPLLASGGVVIAAIVAVLCLVFLRPSKDLSVATSGTSGPTPAAVQPMAPIPAKPVVAAGPEVLPPSLVARWVADDYESGSNWGDRVHHLAAVQTGSPAAIPNAFNGHPGVQLDGKGQYFVINAGDDPVPDARKMTLVVVFKPSIAQKVGINFWQGGGLIGADMKGFDDDFGMAWGGDTGTEVVAGAGNFPHGRDGKVLSPELELNRTHVAVMTWDCPSSSRELATIKLFVDGVLAGEDTQVAESRRSDIPIALGAAAANGSMPFSGMLAEIRIYNDSNLDVAAITENLMRTYVNDKDRTRANPLDPNGLLGR